MARVRHFPDMLKAPRAHRTSSGSRKRPRRTSSEDEADRVRQTKKHASIVGAKRRRIVAAKGRTGRTSISSTDGDEENGELGNSGDAESSESADDSESDVEEPGALAPSGLVSRKHNHRTGLSISLSNAHIGTKLWIGKRGRSHEVEREGRACKAPKLTKEMADPLDSSDDEIYNAVDLISESDEENIEQAEARAIMASADESFSSLVPSRGGSLLSPSGLNGAFTEGEETPHFDEHFARIQTSHLPSPPVAMSLETSNTCKTSGERHVHTSEDMSIDVSESRSRVEADDSNSNGVASDRSQSILEVELEPITESTEATPILEPLSRVGSQLALDGDTTEEELDLPKTVNRPHEKLAKKPTFPTTVKRRPQDTQSAYEPSPQRIKHRGPAVGALAIDVSAPVTFIGSMGHQFRIPPKSIATPPNSRPVVILPQSSEGGSSQSGNNREDQRDDQLQDASDGRAAPFGSPVANCMIHSFNYGLEYIGTAWSASMSFVQEVNRSTWPAGAADDDADEVGVRFDDYLVDHCSVDSASHSDLSPSDESEQRTTATTSPESTTERAASSSPETAVPESPARESPTADSPEWPALHRSSPKLVAGGMRDPRRVSPSSTPSKSSALALKLAGKSVGQRRLKSKHR